MTLSFPYRFAVVLYGEDGNNLGTVPAKRDWEPEYEWTRFYFQRRGQLGLDGNGGASAVIPLWERTLGEPYCRGYRVQIEAPGGQPLGSDFPNTRFRDFASAAASRFVEQKKLREGELYTYTVVAHPAPPEPRNAGGLSVANTSPSVPAQSASLASLLGRATPSGVIDIDDMPVFVSRRVLEEAAERTHAEEGTETGGILIGVLGRDPIAAEIFAEVTAQIPAEHTSGSNVKLTFTPQTWAAADAALRLRRRGEIYLGYWHSHPVRTWCKGKACTLEAQKKCRLAKDFFSADDEAVMRAAFPRAYSIAIVANDTAYTDLTFSLFGNREGITQPRGFYVLEETAHGA
ncbi:MAG: Mov34/MPN/PAD-1 family protein [Terracidiphilus sp.]